MSAPLTPEEREELARSLRWHFACHAAEPDKSYASLGITNAENIAIRIRDAAVAAERERLLARYVSEECATYHEHKGDLPRCPTAALVAAERAGGEES